MDETIKIIVGTLSGFIIAFFAEPIKIFFQNKAKINSIRLALYKEMGRNYVAIYNCFQTYKNEGNKFGEKIQEELMDNCYEYATSQEISLYYQMAEAIDIDDLYKQVRQIKSSTKEEAFKIRLIAGVHNNNFGVSVKLNHFSKTLLKKAMGKNFANFVTSTYDK